MTSRGVKLRDICTVNQGLQIPISDRFKEPGDGRYLYITVQFLKDSYVDKYYIKNPPQSVICRKDDILVVRTGNTGQIITGVEGSFHNNFFKVNYDKNKVDGRYLYHCLTTDEKQGEMLRRAGITTIPDLNHFMFLDIEIPLPNLESQRSISSALDLLSDGINISNNIIKESVNLINKIYRHWFIQFDFPNQNNHPYKSSGGELAASSMDTRKIPHDWSVVSLNDVLKFDKGIEPGAKQYLDTDSGNCVRFYRVSDIDGYSSTFIKNENGLPIAKPSDIIVTFDGSVGKIGIGINGSYSSGLRKIYDPTGKYSSAMIFAIMNDPYIQLTMKKYSTGSVILHASESIKYLKLPYNETVWLQFQDVVNPIFELIIKNKLKVLILEDLLEKLRPMLITGQVEIS